MGSSLCALCAERTHKEEKKRKTRGKEGGPGERVFLRQSTTPDPRVVVDILPQSSAYVVSTVNSSAKSRKYASQAGRLQRGPPGTPPLHPPHQAREASGRRKATTRILFGSDFLTAGVARNPCPSWSYQYPTLLDGVVRQRHFFVPCWLNDASFLLLGNLNRKEPRARGRL